jgi:hypothetical protein
MTRVGLWKRSTTRAATMPTTPGCQPGPEDERPRAPALLGLGDGLDEHPLPRSCGGRSWPGRASRRACGLGEARGAEELEADGGVVEAAGGVDAGPRWKPTWPALTALGLGCGDFLEGADAGALGVGERVEAVAGEDAVGAGEGRRRRRWRATRSMSGLSGGSRRLSNQPRVRSERRSAITRG